MNIILEEEITDEWKDISSPKTKGNHEQFYADIQEYAKVEHVWKHDIRNNWTKNYDKEITEN
jgi:hypothetical protein